MLYLSDRVTNASGSIGGTTFGRNRYGLYTRARRSPVNPQTIYQNEARQAFLDATQAWRTITDAQRAGWELYALNSPIVNRLGQSITLSGQAAYVANNAVHLRFQLTRLDDAPVTTGYGSFGPSPPLAISITAPGTITITAYDATLHDGYIGVQVGPQMSAGRTFFKGPFQLRDFAQATVDPLVFAAANGYNTSAMVAAERYPVRIFGLTTDGRLIVPFIQIVTAA